MNDTFLCRNCGKQLPQTGDAFCTFCREPIEYESSGNSSDKSQTKEDVDQASLTESPGVRSPHHAWLAPLFGIGASLLILFFTSLTREDSESKGVEALPGLAFIAFLFFGLFKSVQCLIGARRVGHGIAGLLINGAALSLVGLMLFVTISAIQNRNSPQTRVRIMAFELEKRIPIHIDESTTVVRVFVEPPTTLNIECKIHSVPVEAFESDAIDQIEKITRENIAKGPLDDLLSIGADLRYVYQHEDGKVLGEFTIHGTVSAPEN